MKKIIVITMIVLMMSVFGMLAMRGNEKDTEVTREVTKIGFLLNGAVDDKGWGQSHYEGINKTADKLNLSVRYRENVPFDDSCMDLMQEMIDEGKPIEVNCHFCDKKYVFEVEDLRKLMK